MATIEVRGYVSYPEAKKTKGGKDYSQFRLGVKQKEKAYKDKPETITWANFQVTDYSNSSPPANKAFVTVKGYLKVREADVNGVKRTFLEINATELEVAESNRSDAAEPEAPAASTAATDAAHEGDPWET